MELLTARELRQTLKISKTTLNRLLQKGLPSVGAGRLRRFELNTVIRWMNGGRNEVDELTVLRAGIYRCSRSDCRYVMVFHEPVSSDKAYCTKCYSRTLEWVGTPWPDLPLTEPTYGSIDKVFDPSRNV